MRQSGHIKCTEVYVFRLSLLGVKAEGKDEGHKLICNIANSSEW
jgi:hypothetical protein